MDKQLLIVTAVVLLATCCLSGTTRRHRMRETTRKSSRHRRERIDRLPNVTKMPSFNMYGGYLDGGNGQNLYYWLNECENASSNVLILWLNGGPGCSSMFGLLRENGPFTLDESTHELKRNKHSWNRLGATLYLDAPIGVGFSYSDRDAKASDLDDHTTAESNLHALNHFIELYPQYKDAELYLSGESYAGIYIPTLAAEILKENKTLARNLKGIALGNPLLNLTMNDEMQVDYMYNHGFIGRPLFETLTTDACTGRAGSKTEKEERKCSKAATRFKKIFEDPALNAYNYAKQSACRYQIEDEQFDANYEYGNEGDYTLMDYPGIEEYSGEDFQNDHIGMDEYGGLSSVDLRDMITEAFSENSLTLEQMKSGMVPGEQYLEELKQMNGTSMGFMKMQAIIEDIINATKESEPDCQIKTDFAKYLQREDVQKAIHAEPIQYKACSDSIGNNYGRVVEDVSDYIKQIYNANVSILLYYGDHDLMCPFRGGEVFINKLGLECTRARSPWYVQKHGSIGGFFEKYGHLWYATIKAAGHMAPEDRPVETFTLLRRFISKCEK